MEFLPKKYYQESTDLGHEKTLRNHVCNSPSYRIATQSNVPN